MSAATEKAVFHALGTWLASMFEDRASLRGYLELSIAERCASFPRLGLDKLSAEDWQKMGRVAERIHREREEGLQ